MTRKQNPLWRWLLAAFFVGAGTYHFIKPAPYLAMMPADLPWPEGLVAVSGLAEIAGGVGLLLPWPRLRTAAGWGLIALLLAVFPANLNVARHGWPGVNLPVWALWARLPFQLVFIVWVYWVALAKAARPA